MTNVLNCNGSIMLDTTGDDAELLLEIDFNGGEEYIDLPSPDGSRSFTTINDIYEFVSDQSEEKTAVFNKHLHSELAIAEEVVFSDSDVSGSSSEKPRDLTKGLPLVIFNNADGQNTTDNESSDSDNEVMESESRTAYGSLIPTTVEAACKWDKTPRKEKVHRNMPKPKSIKNSRPVVVPQRKISKPKPQKQRAVERKRNLLLWQFLLSVLHNTSHNPSVMMWLNFKEGIFKIVHSQSLAKLWGVCRNKNTGVKYEFFARAMRHYYRQGIIKRIPGKKLVYQFGEKIDWKKNRYTKQLHQNAPTKC